VKFSICNEIFQNWKLDDLMPFARQASYEGIEIAPFTFADSVTAIICAPWWISAPTLVEELSLWDRPSGAM
jgi:hypothetical protein